MLPITVETTWVHEEREQARGWPHMSRGAGEGPAGGVAGGRLTGPKRQPNCVHALRMLQFCCGTHWRCQNMRTLPAKTSGSPATPQQPTYWQRITALQVKTARKREYLGGRENGTGQVRYRLAGGVRWQSRWRSEQG